MSNRQREVLHAIADELADMMARHHPGRPGYSALSRAVQAVKEAAQDVGEQNAPVRPKARVLPVLGTIGGDGAITFRQGRREAS